MENTNDKLLEIKSDLEDGSTPTATVRELLSWFNSQRRGTNVVSQIRKQFGRIGLDTQPDFEIPHLDVEIQFVEKASDENELRTIPTPYQELANLMRQAISPRR